MRVTIEVPDVYADAIRWELQRRGYEGSVHQVAQVLRHCIDDATKKHWWKTKGYELWMRGNPKDLDAYREGTLAPWPAVELPHA